MRTYEEYKEEYLTLLDMFRCSNRYLSSSGRRAMVEGNEELQKCDLLAEKKFLELFNKYSNQLREECLRDTNMEL